MHNRRQFLCRAIRTIGGASVTLLLTPLIGCGDDSTPTPSPAPTTPAPTTTANPTLPPPGSGCDGAQATSTFTLDHNHSVCVPLADINAPPVGGRTYTTSAASTDGHVHQLSLTLAQLTALAQNQTIVVTTTVNESHTHDFSLVKNAPTASTTPAPAPTTAPGPY